MLNKLDELKRLLSYSYTPQNAPLLNNILNSTIERCETIYYNNILYPQLETIWNNEKSDLSFSDNESIDSVESTPCSPTPLILSRQNTCKNNIKDIYTKNIVLKDITVLIYICIATQPTSAFLTDQLYCH